MIGQHIYYSPFQHKLESTIVSGLSVHPDRGVGENDGKGRFRTFLGPFPMCFQASPHTTWEGKRFQRGRCPPRTQPFLLSCTRGNVSSEGRAGSSPVGTNLTQIKNAFPLQKDVFFIQMQTQSINSWKLTQVNWINTMWLSILRLLSHY